MEVKTPKVEPPRVRPGVFFEPLQALPRGRHSLTTDEVRAIQQERILVSMTELLAAHGPRGFGSGEISKNAGVSLAAFYDCFESKEACALAGYDRFIEVLFHRMNAVDVGDKSRPELVCALIRAYLETLQSDLVVAKAYQVEIDTLGASVRKLRRDSLLLFAHHLWGVSSDDSPEGRGPDVLPWSAYIGVIYTTRQLASDALDTESEPDLLALSDELAIWVSDLFR
jgi:AcrR family transcriptional regulator